MYLVSVKYFRNFNYTAFKKKKKLYVCLNHEVLTELD